MNTRVGQQRDHQAGYLTNVQGIREMLRHLRQGGCLLVAVHYELYGRERRPLIPA